MIHQMVLGRVPAKPHTALYSTDKGTEGQLLMEHCLTREGFEGPFSILYYKTPPTDESAVEEIQLPGFCPFTLGSVPKLHRQHLRTAQFPHAGDFLYGRKTILVNDDLQIGVIKTATAPTRFFSNADGDELYFIKQGDGVLESLYGFLPFRCHDYLLVPRSTPYRLHFNGHHGTALVFEGRPKIAIPSEYRNSCGQISMYAPYSHRDFRVPERLLAYDEQRHGKGPFPHVVKMCDRLSVHTFKHFPFELEGWDGAVYPVAFNIHDYQAKTGLVHLPPTIHTTFAGKSFVICSFVPRLVDYHPQAIPCPYGHANVEMDEILYYVDGNFTSRKGIESESISLHPQGIPHGPHPGTYAKSIGTKRTEELAVMCGGYQPFRLTSLAESVEQKDYHTTWVETEDSPAK